MLGTTAQLGPLRPRQSRVWQATCARPAPRMRRRTLVHLVSTPLQRQRRARTATRVNSATVARCRRQRVLDHVRRVTRASLARALQLARRVSQGSTADQVLQRAPTALQVLPVHPELLAQRAILRCHGGVSRLSVAVVDHDFHVMHVVHWQGTSGTRRRLPRLTAPDLAPLVCIVRRVWQSAYRVPLDTHAVSAALAATRSCVQPASTASLGRRPA